MRQWGAARADHARTVGWPPTQPSAGEYRLADECIRSLPPDGDALRAWHQIMHNTTDLPNEIHVAVGEDLTPHPLHLDREEIQRLLYDGGCSDALLQSIVDADLNKIMLHLQPHDPVSWHCTSKSAQQQWFLTVRPREAV